MVLASPGPLLTPFAGQWLPATDGDGAWAVRTGSGPMRMFFDTMTDTDVKFLSCYNTVGHTRMHVMTLTSPTTLTLSSRTS
jgi:hypothetical protein